jgi:hypothetical protein
MAGGGLRMLWSSPQLDVSVTNQGTSAVSRTISVPPLAGVRAVMNWTSTHASARVTTYVRDQATTDEAVDESTAKASFSTLGSGGQMSGQIEVHTSTGAVETRSSTTSVTLRMATVLWEWSRR